MDGGAWWATVHGVANSQARLSNFTFTHWKRQWQTTSVFLPGESQGWRSLVGCHLWGRMHALEKEMATHSSIFAWRIPGTEEPGGLPSMGSHKVGHD